MKRTTFILFIALLVFPLAGKAQTKQPAINQSDYSFAIGLRAGYSNGLTLKSFRSNNVALEGIINAWYRGIAFTGLYEKHIGVDGAPGLRWYYGAGGHVAIRSDRNFYKNNGRWDNRFDNDGNLGLGIDGIVGIEYKINPIPFAISLDVKPMIEVNTAGGFWTALDPGLGIKFTF